MVQIAERAGVVPTTLYNLFQTKEAIFRQVFDRDLEMFQRKVEQAPAKDALDRIFVAIEIAAAIYEKDPQFYRAMSHAPRARIERLSVGITKPRIAFYQAQVAAAIAAGRLRPDTDARLLGITLCELMAGVFFEWAVEAITPQRLEAEASFGFAMLLRGFVAPEAASQLNVRFEASRRILLTTERRADVAA